MTDEKGACEKEPDAEEQVGRNLMRREQVGRNLL
jgi:hypothetical protein